MRILAALSILWMSLFAAPAALAQQASDFYHWRPAADDNAPRPWAVLLPGSGGLSILGGDQHYFRAASWLNSLGVDALVIDYHRATRFVPGSRDGEAGDRMAAIVADALAFERAAGRAQAACPGAVLGWSLGAEGAWTLAAGDQVRAAVMYYPTVRRPQPYRNVAPVLVLQGGVDNVTPEAELRAFVGARAAESAPLAVVSYAGAEHGFDVESLTRPRSMRFPPLVGQRVTFAYSAGPASEARAAAAAFLREQGVVGGACGAGSGG
jgi:dienelactone hydrolase